MQARRTAAAEGAARSCPALGVNIDHVATLRQARGVDYPDPLEAARLAQNAGADIITVHLREDRRHIQDRDVEVLRAEIRLPIYLEMAATAAMVAIARRVRPAAACIVPERRTEVTTEGGLAVAGHEERLTAAVEQLHEAGMRVSLFIDPEPREIEATRRVGAALVEFHTGRYANARDEAAVAEQLGALRAGADLAASFGLQVNAGHGLTVANVTPIARLPHVRELHIGHSIVARAVLIGMEGAVREMRAAISAAVAGVTA